MPIHEYTNWNSRTVEQKEPYRKYIFICEGANTETFYFQKLIDLRKELGIHPLVDIRLWEKTDEDKDISYPKKLVEFAEQQKEIAVDDDEFDLQHDKLVVVFDGDIFEEKVLGYDELVRSVEKNNIAIVTNPSFELFLLLHIDDSYKNYIKDHEAEFFMRDERNKYSYAYKILREVTGMNAKKNSEIGNLAKKIRTAIVQEKFINQDIHQIKGTVSSNAGLIIESIINEEPDI